MGATPRSTRPGNATAKSMRCSTARTRESKITLLRLGHPSVKSSHPNSRKNTRRSMNQLPLRITPLSTSSNSWGHRAAVAIRISRFKLGMTQTRRGIGKYRRTNHTRNGSSSRCGHQTSSLRITDLSLREASSRRRVSRARESS